MTPRSSTGAGRPSRDEAQPTAPAEPAAEGARPEPAPPPPRRRRALLAVAGIAAVVVLGVLVYVLLHAGEESTDDAQVDADVVALAARVAGLVVAVPIGANQPVKQGDLVLRLDDRDYQARLEQASGELESARAQADAADAQVAVAEAAARGSLTQAEAGLAGSNRSVAGARDQLQLARANLGSRETDLKLAETNLRRAQELAQAEALPPQQLDQVQAQFESAEAGVEAARAAVNVADQALRRALAQVGESRGRVAVSRPVEASIAAARASAAFQHARVKSAEAAQALARLNLEWTRVVAPADGVVSGISSFVGAFVGIGQNVAQLVPDRKYVTANFKETQVGKMGVGQAADVAVDTYGRKIAGKVESLAGGTGARFSLFPPDNAAGNFVKVAQRIPVRIALDGVPADMVLRAGQSVVVTVHVGK
jgi:membrane fusion protein (multidrug efflux system)